MSPYNPPREAGQRLRKQAGRQRRMRLETTSIKLHRKAGRDTQTMSKVRITNPNPGCAKYTTESQADRYVRRGEAVLIGSELTFLSKSERGHMVNIERQMQQGRSRSDVYVDPKGMTFWNGATVGMHRPGEVRS